MQRLLTSTALCLGLIVALTSTAGAAGDACPGAGDCYDANGSVGCDDGKCCELVCLADPFCCDVQWDQVCANGAIQLCLGCGGQDAGDCFDENGSIGCDDAECCFNVCQADPFCCSTTWDALCADQAREICCNTTWCTGDFNGDFKVDSADLAFLLAEWGPGGSCADMTEDDQVGPDDLANLLVNWGFCIE